MGNRTRTTCLQYYSYAITIPIQEVRGRGIRMIFFSLEMCEVQGEDVWVLASAIRE